MFKGINSKQSSGFWVFLCHPPSSSTSSRWGMLWGIRIWGRTKWIDLASLNTLPKMFWGAACTCNCKVPQRLLRAVLLWQTLDLVTFQYTSVPVSIYLFIYFLILCCCYVVVSSVCRAYTAQTALRISVEKVVRTLIPNILPLCCRYTVSVVASLNFFDLGGCFVCLATGQSSF